MKSEESTSTSARREIDPEGRVPDEVHDDAERIARNLLGTPPQTHDEFVRERRKKYRTVPKKGSA